MKRKAREVKAHETALLIQDSAKTAGIIIDKSVAMFLALGGERIVNGCRYIGTAEGDLFVTGRVRNNDSLHDKVERTIKLRRFIKDKQTAVDKSQSANAGV